MLNVKYTLYFETNNSADSDEIGALVAKYVQGATIQAAAGLWRGDINPSWVVTILGDGGATTREDVEALAGCVRLTYSQESVLLTTEPVNMFFITGKE